MRRKNFDGFTMIETMLVLAIGGLIFAMVFLALPAVFANARDGERRNDVLLTINKLKNFQANNNRGALPTDKITDSGVYINGSSIAFGPTTGVTWTDFYKSFFDNTFADPNGTRYNWQIINCGTSSKKATIGSECPNPLLASFNAKTFETNNVTMYFVIGATCNGEKAVATANSRMVAVLYRLERAGIYCANT